ncbi:MAG: biliverdin-producing heme oxygenase [Bacteroidia bacterium]|nr:biliverdin-producing heme oxygenase [Bacteroidia bacterium]
MTEVNFLNELRERIGPMHKALEQTVISKQITSPSLTPQQYQNYLQKMFCVHEAVEKNVFPHLKQQFNDITERTKTPAILNDLKGLNSHIENCSVSFIDDQFVSSIPFCLGIMYVTEGSTLGGIYILKNVSAIMGDRTKNVSYFFNCYGQHTGTKWKTFLEVLNSYAASASDKEKNEIIAGAVYGFNRTYEVFKS